MHTFLGNIIIFLLKAVSLLPIQVLYALSNLLAWLNFNLFQYRKKVVFNNLKNSFPLKTDKELNKLTYQFYVFLADLVVESLKAFIFNKEQLAKRVSFQNPELLLKYTSKNQPIILTIGHYANWELVGIAAGAIKGIRFYSLFRSLKNEAVNNFVFINRQQFGLKLIEEKLATKQIPALLKAQEPNVVVFLADQAITPKRAYWINFLNQETTFVKGPELYAKKYDCPIFFAEIHKVKRGFYNVVFHLITDVPKQTEQQEIMTKYAKLLEQEIKNDIPNWLWSHKRWKHKR